MYFPILERHLPFPYWGLKGKYVIFQCLQTSRELFNSWNGYQKLYVGITWFSDSVQAGIFVAEHEGWVKKEYNLVKKITFYMYHKTLQNGLKS